MWWWALPAFFALIALRWLYGHVEISAALRQRLQPAAADVAVPPGRLSVIIAAQNEEATIRTCLERVLAQDHPDLEIIVANDRSHDRTGAIVREMAAAHANIKCIDIAELPTGWLGKTHAVWVATQHATGDALVFTDSDVEWHPRTLATVAALADRRQIDFLSLWPRVVLGSFWERLLLPPCGLLLATWYPSSDPEDLSKTPPFANGQFIFIRRAAYEQIGGHATVANEMTEDVALAARAKSAGLRCYVGLGSGLIETRMYENRRQIVRGWTRIYIGALGAMWKLVLTLVMIVLGYVVPFGVLAWLGVHAARGLPCGAWEWTWLALSVTHLAGMYSTIYRQGQLAYRGGPFTLLFPIGMMGAAAILLNAMRLLAGFGSVQWGNTRYRVRGSRAVASARV
jgi:cellulose synthase/poly-beta-1,6-N-acetylglucosamine synthase-like glycosyltransferase